MPRFFAAGMLLCLLFAAASHAQGPIITEEEFYRIEFAGHPPKEALGVQFDVTLTEPAYAILQVSPTGTNASFQDLDYLLLDAGMHENRVLEVYRSQYLGQAIWLRLWVEDAKGRKHVIAKKLNP